MGPENIPDLLELRRADIIATRKITTVTYDYWKDLSERVIAILKTSAAKGGQIKLALTGHDLIEQLNISPGPLVGKILAYLLELVFNDPALNRKDLLLDLARKYIDFNPPDHS